MYIWGIVLIALLTVLLYRFRKHIIQKNLDELINAMVITEYNKLPDFLPVEKLAIMFEKVLNEYNLNKINDSLFLEILVELADRQSNTYEILRDDIRNNIDSTLCKLWNTTSLDEVETTTYLIVNLGLEKCFEMAKESLIVDKNMDMEIRKEIEETIEEVGENIRNPFYDLDSKFKHR